MWRWPQVGSQQRHKLKLDATAFVSTSFSLYRESHGPKHGVASLDPNTVSNSMFAGQHLILQIAIDVVPIHADRRLDAPRT